VSPGHPDRTLVERHLYALEAAVLQLRRHAGKPLEALQDLDEAWAVQRGLQLCAQNALDVATHLLAGAGRDAPDYASALDGLGALGVLSPALLARFRGVAGFRNILVHGYLELDLRRVHAVLNERLDDFGEYASAVRSYLASLGAGGS